MDWEKLLSPKRLGRNDSESVQDGSSQEHPRSEFERDHDRIIFSSAFRRMQDKTQVFPLASMDYVRTRLTHSLEVSCVGRSLGNMVAKFLKEEKNVQAENVSQIGSIVAAACLAHDIGNPPFGHAGEDAIQSWFKEWRDRCNGSELNCEQWGDLIKFEGNAQGLRILTKLRNGSLDNGMDLTCAVLGTFMKYPRGSCFTTSDEVDGLAGLKKHGFNVDDESAFKKVAIELGLAVVPGNEKAWMRHPLAYLVEAADDICYRIVDLEDGFRMGRVSFDETVELLNPLVHKQYEDKSVSNDDLTRSKQQQEVSYLRAQAINELAESAAEVFKQDYEDILAGRFKGTLTNVSKHKYHLEEIKQATSKKIYSTPSVIQIEVSGYKVLGELLELFIPAVLNCSNRGSAYNEKLIELLPLHLRPTDTMYDYQKILCVTDHISGMTDTYAVSLYRHLTGIELPTDGAA